MLFFFKGTPLGTSSSTSTIGASTEGGGPFYFSLTLAKVKEVSSLSWADEDLGVKLVFTGSREGVGAKRKVGYLHLVGSPKL